MYPLPHSHPALPLHPLLAQPQEAAEGPGTAERRNKAAFREHREPLPSLEVHVKKGGLLVRDPLFITPEATIIHLQLSRK